MGNSVTYFKQEQTSSFASQPLLIPPISVEAENENLRVFSFKELKKATKNFRQDRVVIGDDKSVRKFYKGYINETTFAPPRTETGIAVSVMECLQEDSSQALQEWMEQVKSLGQISHPNLVKFLGCCCKDNKSFLVFEYLHKGSLDHYIYGKEEVLPWEIRVKIAIGTAQGIAFLHSVKNSPLYQELRMHNIMLDEQYNAKLFYLESNKQSVRYEWTFVGGNKYIPPEYMSVTEADVYTFGVILLELLTGSKDRSNILNKQKFNVWTRSFLPDNDKIGEIIDPRLGNDYPVNAATRMGTLIKRCIGWDIEKRPLMQQVLDGLNDIAEMKD